MIANVILTDSSHAIDRIFDYKIPEEFNASAVIGRRVLVPFGNRNASAEGLIVALSETSDYKRLKPILQCLDEYPICSEETVRLCFSMQSRYICSFQQAYKLVKPPHLNTNVHSWLVYVKESDTKLTKSQELLLNTLKEFDGVAELDELEAHLNKRSLKQSAYALKDMGLIDIREKIGSTLSEQHSCAVLLRKAIPLPMNCEQNARRYRRICCLPCATAAICQLMIWLPFPAETIPRSADFVTRAISA